MINAECAPVSKVSLPASSKNIGSKVTHSAAIKFSSEHSMFSRKECFWHEFHYFVSQLYHGEKIGVEIARKLRDSAISSELKTNLNRMLADEVRHVDLFEQYLLETFGDIFPAAMGMERIVRMCSGTDDPLVLAVVTHGVLEPCGMVTLKALRRFVTDRKFREFTSEVLRDEGHHISLINQTDHKISVPTRETLQASVAIAFKSTASIGRAKELITYLKSHGFDLSKERPLKSTVYKQKFDLSIRVVKKQLDNIGIEVF